MITRQIRVWGRVHVGSLFTQQLAIQLDIYGTVQNKMDGSVFMHKARKKPSLVLSKESQSLGILLMDVLIVMKKCRGCT